MEVAVEHAVRDRAAHGAGGIVAGTTCGGVSLMFFCYCSLLCRLMSVL